MKKLLGITLVTLLGLAGLLGCSGASESSPAKLGFTENVDGSFTLIDTVDSPLPQGGVKIDLVTGPEGYVNFTVTDKDGTETADYYRFTPADSTMLRYRYVAAMGMTYNYYYDYTAMNLVKVTDADDSDVTERLKTGGRWDSAVSETKEHAEALIGYFHGIFGGSIDEVVGN